MTKPIPDKAEVALEYPDKLYIGTFERCYSACNFDPLSWGIGVQN